MSRLFGWDLPPGCTQRQIDEACGAGSQEEAFAENMADLFPPEMDDELVNKIVDWAWKQVSQAYGDGYRDGQSDERLANEYNAKTLPT